jgi:hypothetical protein
MSITPQSESDLRRGIGTPAGFAQSEMLTKQFGLYSEVPKENSGPA